MNILGNYQVWLGILNQNFGQCSRSKFVDSFDTQKEAVDFVEQNYTLYSKPKWVLFDKPSQVETALKKTKNSHYDGVLIATKSSAWHLMGANVKLNGSVQMNDIFFDIFKTGTITKVEIINEVIRWKVEFELFNEKAYKYISMALGNWTGPGCGVIKLPIDM